MVGDQSTDDDDDDIQDNGSQTNQSQTNQPQNSQPQSRLGPWLQEAGLQADTAVRNAANVLTLGFANNVEAGGDALLGMGGPGDLAQRYQANLNDEAARAVYDNYHRGLAKALGQVGGVGIALGGGWTAGVKGSAALPIRTKGLLGEALSVGKTILSGDWPVEFQVPHLLQDGSKTIVDHDTAKGISVEAKFGPSARLSRNQTKAQQQWGDTYRVDRWGPQHIGPITGVPAGAAALGSAAFQNQQGQRNRQP